MNTESKFQLPSGYERGIRFGANWTMIISPYLILYIILVILVGLQDDSGDIAVILKFAGSAPASFVTTVFLDGLFHVLFFVTVVTLFTLLHESFPVQANMLLVCGTWQMLMGFTKWLIASFVFPKLGSAYLSVDPTLQATFIPVANAFDAMRNALQWMDSLGVCSFGSLFRFCNNRQVCRVLSVGLVGSWLLESLCLNPSFRVFFLSFYSPLSGCSCLGDG